MSVASPRARRALLVLALLALATIAVPGASALGGGGGVAPMPGEKLSPSDGAPSAPLGPSLRGVAQRPNEVDVLVNKRVRLPGGFVPPSLVVPRVPFTFSGFHEKRQLRRVAARALELMFAAAAADGVPLAGVSGYRSEATQRSLFDYYVGQMGTRAASRVSARPGHSEHQTGLAIDISGADGSCQATSCFARTPAARWIAAHAARYGFIVRYPAGAEAITGYKYEPWHVRYLGRALATELTASRLTYEQFLEEGVG